MDELPSTTEGYLLINAWKIYANESWSPEVEIEFMESLQKACREADKTLDEFVDWGENDSVFDYEYADEHGPGSLASIVLDAAQLDKDVRQSVINWIMTTSLPLKKDAIHG